MFKNIFEVEKCVDPLNAKQRALISMRETFKWCGAYTIVSVYTII